MLSVRLNCSTTTEVAPELVEVIWLSPCISPNCRSSGAVTVVATTSGLAPWIEGEHLDGGVVHFRQGGDGQLGVGDDTHQHDRGHQQ